MRKLCLCFQGCQCSLRISSQQFSSTSRNALQGVLIKGRRITGWLGLWDSWLDVNQITGSEKRSAFFKCSLVWFGISSCGGCLHAHYSYPLTKTNLSWEELKSLSQNVANFFTFDAHQLWFRIFCDSFYVSNICAILWHHFVLSYVHGSQRIKSQRVFMYVPIFINWDSHSNTLCMV